MHVVVIGAGLTGLSAAHELLDRGHQVTVLEAESVVGGMAASWRRGPFWLDFGPHRFHTRDPELEQHLYEVLDGGLVRRERLSRIYLRGRFFRYPLQVGNVLANLDGRVLLAVVRDYLLARMSLWFRPIPDDNFENWVKKRFGRTLYQLFFEAYTSKTWGLPCDQISADWAAQRIPLNSLWDTAKKALRPPRDGEVRSLAHQFLYPRRGGIGRIARKYAEKIRARGGSIRLTAPLSCLEPDGPGTTRVHYLYLGERECLDADWVINTVPLPALVDALSPEAPRPVREAAESLDHVAILFVYLDVSRPTVSPDHWIYLPQEDLRVHRVSEFKNFSDATAPGDRTVICCEITCREGDATWCLDLEEAAEVARADLEHCGLLEPGEARALDLARLPRAYPVYDLDYRNRLEVVNEYVGSLPRLSTTGRQGLFRYNNMDHSIRMGRETARRVAGGVEASEIPLPGGWFG